MYKVIDWYEDREVLGTVETRKEALALAKERMEDTDGECDIEIMYLPKTERKVK